MRALDQFQRNTSNENTSCHLSDSPLGEITQAGCFSKSNRAYNTVLLWTCLNSIQQHVIKMKFNLLCINLDLICLNNFQFTKLTPSTWPNMAFVLMPTAFACSFHQTFYTS